MGEHEIENREWRMGDGKHRTSNIERPTSNEGRRERGETRVWTGDDEWAYRRNGDGWESGRGLPHSTTLPRLRGGPGARKHPKSAQKGRLDCPSRVQDPHLWGQGNVRALRQQRPTRSKGLVRFGGWFCVVFGSKKGEKPLCTGLNRFAQEKNIFTRLGKKLHAVIQKT